MSMKPLFNFRLVDTRGDPAPARKYPAFQICEDSIYFPSWARFWVSVGTYDDEYFVDFCAEHESAGYPPDHWLEYMYEGETLTEMLFPLADTPMDVATVLMREGVAPGQRFLVHMTFRATGDAWDGYDCEIDWWTLDIEPWPPEKISLAWEAWLGRYHYIGPG